MIKTDIILTTEYTEIDLHNAVCERLGRHAAALRSVTLLKRSTDTSKKPDLRYKITVGLTLDEDTERLLCGRKRFEPADDLDLEIPPASPELRPVVIGFGPAGMFAALVLAEAGAAPVVLERGEEVDRRISSVSRFFGGGDLDTESNIQFGEGGAGAFSDGKLKSGKRDRYNNKVLSELVKAGAPDDIMYDSGAHIGTDRLPGVVKKIREKIIKLGGNVIFGAKATDFSIVDGEVKVVKYEKEGVSHTIETSSVILAAGHSATDVFELLKRHGIPMKAKGIGVGVRIEHPQTLINELVYGDPCPPSHIGAASYRLVTHLDNGRSVYSFCMCPGGSVVAAASENGGVVTNGMSAYARNGTNANAALLVSVTPKDYGGPDPLAGLAYQRAIERRVFEYTGGFTAPVQKLCDFMSSSPSHSLGSITPTYPRGTVPSDLERCLPDYITESLRLAMPEFEAWMPGYCLPDAVLTAAETRSTSPVCIIRNEFRQAPGAAGLYPCGEGSGNAGGIVSSAVDGIKSAEMMILNSLDKKSVK